MKKGVVALLILVIVGAIYFFSLRGMSKDTENTTVEEVKKESSIQLELEKQKKEIETHYPATPEEVILAHNSLVTLFYSGQMSEDLAQEYAESVRLLYAQDFLDLNPVDAQVAGIKEEIQVGKQYELKLISSQILEVTKTVDEKEEAVDADILVKHIFNTQSFTQEYLLVLDEGLWKISAWENVESQEIEEQ